MQGVGPRFLKQDPRGETERRPWLRRTPAKFAIGGARQRGHCPESEEGIPGLGEVAQKRDRFS